MMKKKKNQRHSKRHLVHEPNGDVIGEWGMKVWGRPKSKQGRDAKRQNAHIQRQELQRIQDKNEAFL